MSPHADRLEQALRGGTLVATAKALRDEGLTHAELYAAFEAMRARLRLDGRDADEDRVMEVMDQIVGWCSPSSRMFHESGSNG